MPYSFHPFKHSISYPNSPPPRTTISFEFESRDSIGVRGSCLPNLFLLSWFSVASSWQCGSIEGTVLSWWSVPVERKSWRIRECREWGFRSGKNEWSGLREEKRERRSKSILALEAARSSWEFSILLVESCSPFSVFLCFVSPWRRWVGN